ncbi:MAG: ferritin-like domain-containing protein [Acidimicrobiales bacterium]
MTIDDRALTELIEESEDLQVDALRTTQSATSDLVEIRHEALRNGIDPDERAFFNDRYNANRRQVLRNGGMGLGAFAARGALATGFGAALTAVVAGPAAAKADDVDVMVLQTAASLEILAVATYGAALGLDFIKNGNKTVKVFAMTTMKQHDAHDDAFNAAAKTLGGKAQKNPNPKYKKVVDDALPTLTDPAKVVALAMSLEKVATDTYNNDIALMRDNDAKKVMGSIMGVESQHLATLRAVAALLDAGAADLITVKDTDGAVDLAKLPAAAGSVAFPKAFEPTDMASPPEEGAVK